ATNVLTGIARAEYNPIQVASFLTVYQMRAIALQELQGFREALLGLCIPFDVQGAETIDIVGTGGDGKQTFNISTLAAVVLAGAGYKVTKHGSYGVSSIVGSSNVLEALGYQFTNDTDLLRRQLDSANLCFLHAPLFHPALKEVVPVRKQLVLKTFFNMLGPLVNPVQPHYQVLGTYSLELSRLYQYVMQEAGRRFAVVHTLDGNDEISLTDEVRIYANEGQLLITPEEMGFRRLKQAELAGGQNAAEAVQIFHEVLNGEGPAARIDVVVANAGMGIHCIKPQQSLADSIAEAKESLVSGRAKAAFQKLLDTK
ncbi:MAG: anthranilate phosphoribosyltransferase, partial [Saprospiraceae bacterium]|nr:anthranilate phosphoribosyltransferase [Saprospiraceae bacterium]